MEKNHESVLIEVKNHWNWNCMNFGTFGDYGISIVIGLQYRGIAC